MFYPYAKNELTNAILAIHFIIMINYQEGTCIFQQIDLSLFYHYSWICAEWSLSYFWLKKNIFKQISILRLKFVQF